MGGRTSFIRFIPIAVVVLILAAVGLGAQPEAEQEAPDQGAAPKAHYFSGGDLFKTYCASCHGLSAKGDGPLAASMKKAPPDLTLFAERNGGEYPSELVRKIIDGRQPLAGHGGPDMPVWGDAFKRSHGGSSEEAVGARIDALVRHLAGLQVRRASRSTPSGPASAP